MSKIENKERAIIFIDGSNFYFKLKDLKLQNLLDFDFSGLVKMLVRGRKSVGTIYYIGKVRTGRSGKFVSQKKSCKCLAALQEDLAEVCY